MPNLKRAISSTSFIVFAVMITSILGSPSRARAGWLRIQHKPFNEGQWIQTDQEQNSQPTPVVKSLAQTLKAAQTPAPPAQDLVILNTQNGFIPNTLRLRVGNRYRIHVVNINPSQKNVSFMLDAFSKDEATYYGQLNSFVIQPSRDGIFSFECPETASQGQIVVYTDKDDRLPAGATP